MQLKQLQHTGLSREASVINLRNSSQPDDIEVTEPPVLVSTSITSFRFSLSSDNVSAININEKINNLVKSIICPFNNKDLTLIPFAISIASIMITLFEQTPAITRNKVTRYKKYAMTITSAMR